MRRPCVASLVIAIAILLASGGQASADEQDGRLVPHSADTWSVSGSLDAVRLGDRTVRELYVSHLGPDTAKGLQPLTAFHELRRLHLEVVWGVDLAPLAELDLEALSLEYVRDVDLAPLNELEELVWLSALDLRNVRVPPTLTLPGSLSVLLIANGGWRETGAPAKALIDAIDWTRLGGLRDLHLSVGFGESLEPITVDLGFLRGLSRLVGLEINDGVRHRGALPSPLAPPFDALAPGLRRIVIDSWRPAQTRRVLERRYPKATVIVDQRYPREPGRGPWTLSPPTKDAPGWGTYGSLWEAADGHHGDTESEALRAARRKLRRVAPRLLARLDFDSEADGTGITAPTRWDLVRALRILGIR